MKEANFEKEAQARLREELSRVPFLQLGKSASKGRQSGHDRGFDFAIPVKSGQKSWTLICESKLNGQPRHVRMSVLQLGKALERMSSGNAYAVLIAPYISPESAQICHEAKVGFLDFTGNCFLSFDYVYVEYKGEKRASLPSRGLRSLFAAKSARVLRVLLAQPTRAWKVVELAERAGVSLGQVSNIRKGLIDREWAKADEAGLRVERPEAILDAWHEAYVPARQQRNRYHTVLHGEALDAAIRAAFKERRNGHLLLASFSAARWLAPYAKVPSNYFYADEAGEKLLKKHLKLESVLRGENAVIDLPKDEGVFLDRIEPVPGLWCTGLIQTYLDLAASGERGAEAAEHLRSEKLERLWKETA